MKTCTKCRNEKLATVEHFPPMKTTRDGLSPWCRTCQYAAVEEWRRANRARVNARTRALRAENPERARIYQAEWRRKKDYSRASRRRLKMEVLHAYGGEHPACACCGESTPEFLAIDHLNGGGKNHRDNLIRSGTNMYAWLKREGFPPGFQVLCHNCNCALGYYGACPHRPKVVRVVTRRPRRTAA